MSEEIQDANIENIPIIKKVNPHNERTAWRSQGEKYDSRPTNYKEYLPSITGASITPSHIFMHSTSVKKLFLFPLFNLQS